MTTRYAAAVAVLVSVTIHLVLWFQGMRTVHVIGPAFLLNVTGGIVIAALLVRWRHPAAGFLAACFGAATLGAFTVASTIGLFGDHPEWAGFSVFAAAISEVLAVLTGLAIMLEDPDAVPAQPQSLPASNRSESA